MIRIAVYGKGGIGKSTTVSNVAAALAEMGLKVMQIGCDPKADSTILLRHGKAVPAVLDLYNEKKQALQLEDMIRIGYNGVICVEAGGPTPGLGCAGRGIITALEKLKELGAYDVYKPDVVLYDVLGDVVCGGFSMPMRGGYADKIFIITSGENMAIHAAANIAMAVENFKKPWICRAWRTHFKSQGCPAGRGKSGRTGRRFSHSCYWYTITQRAGGTGRGAEKNH